MFKKILVPSDFSNPTAAAFSSATELAAAGKGSLLLLHVIEVLKDIPFEELRDFYQEIEQSIRTKMKVVSDALASRSISVSSEIRYGNRLHEIMTVCKEQQVDLLVMQSHLINPAQPHEGWGTLSQRLAIVAPCAVLLVR